MIYSAIIHYNTPIADYSEIEGDFQKMMIKLLKANRQPLEFYAIPYQDYEYYYLHQDDYTFSCIASPNLDNEKILIYLQTLREKFTSMCVNEKENLTLNSTNLLRDLMV